MDLFHYYQPFFSQRLCYRKLTKEDRISWTAFYHQNPNLKYLKIDLNRPVEVMANAWIQAQIDRYERNEFGQLGMYLRFTDELIGTIGFKISEYCEAQEIEKLISIKPAFWKQGYGTEASQAVINTIFEHDLAKAIISIRHTDNQGTAKLWAILGFEELEKVQQTNRVAIKARLLNTKWKARQSFYFSS